MYRERFRLGRRRLWTAHLIFSPGFQPPTIPATSAKEAGHIPSWLRARLFGCAGLSPSLVQCLRTFNDRYEDAIKKGEMRIRCEARLLRDLAKEFPT